VIRSGQVIAQVILPSIFLLFSIVAGVLFEPVVYTARIFRGGRSKHLQLHA